jgi:hypothetical protein
MIEWMNQALTLQQWFYVFIGLHVAAIPFIIWSIVKVFRGK